jgi:hypothetical protein
MRTIIFLSAALITAAHNISYAQDHYKVITLVLIGAFVWDVVEGIFGKR